MEHPFFAERSTVAAVLELAALSKRDWAMALEHILRIDSHALGVDRTSYWSMREDPRSIYCDLGYIASADAMERGAALSQDEAPVYLGELERARVLAFDDVMTDAGTRELQDYCRARRITSMLDIPVWTESRLAGVLCHEHVGAPRHWSAPEIDFALAVAQVIATAVEARRRTRAEEQERRANFLARAALDLSHSLDEDLVCRRAIAGALPTLGDWGALDLFEGRAVVRKAIVHVDPERQRLLDRYAADYPPRGESPHMTVQVIKLGQAVVVPEVTDETLRHNGFSEQHLARLREIGVRSAMAVPLTAAGVRAALEFVSTTRSFGYDALKLAEEYGERVASALTNARLYHRATEALRARDEFLMLASHELKTPLTSLRISAEQLASGTLRSPPEVAAAAGRILRSSRRLTRLVEHMLDAAGANQPLLLRVRDGIDLVPLVRDVADELSAIACGAPIELSLPARLVGRWDGDRVQELAALLIDNALKFGGGKPIRVALAAEGDRAVLSIADQGDGLAPELMARLFQPYERGVTHRGYGGLGIGLYLARKIVDAHGGNIEVRSRKGAGTEFIARLPGVAPAAADRVPSAP
ncbi:MAG TPA: ATP-binding protein [Polyangia bacterium]|nr:ATP-binding protein [Polyangia bacterium]